MVPSILAIHPKMSLLALVTLMLVTAGVWMLSPSQIASWKARTASEKAMSAYMSGNLSSAEQYYRAALKEFGGDGSRNTQYAQTAFSLADLLERQDRLKEAEIFYRSALTIQAEVLGENSSEAAMTMFCLARVCLDQCRKSESDGLDRTAGERYVQQSTYYSAEHDRLIRKLTDVCMKQNKTYCKNAAFYLQYAAGQSFGLAKYAQAEPLFKKAIEISRKTDPKNLMLFLIARMYLEQGRYAEAEPLFKEELLLEENRYGTKAYSNGTKRFLADLYREEGRNAKAERLYNGILKDCREHPTSLDYTAAEAMNGLATLYRIEKRFAEADTLYAQALKITESGALGAESIDAATIMDGQAVSCTLQKQYADAEPLFVKALHTMSNFRKEHPYTAKIMHDFAYWYIAQGEYAQARPLLEKALRIDTKFLGDAHPETIATAKDMKDLLAFQKH